MARREILLAFLGAATAACAALNPDSLATIVAHGSTYEIGRSIGMAVSVSAAIPRYLRAESAPLAQFADFISARSQSPYMVATFEYVKAGKVCGR